MGEKEDREEWGGCVSCSVGGLWSFTSVLSSIQTDRECWRTAIVQRPSREIERNVKTTEKLLYFSIWIEVLSFSKNFDDLARTVASIYCAYYVRWFHFSQMAQYCLVTFPHFIYSHRTYHSNNQPPDCITTRTPNVSPLQHAQYTQYLWRLIACAYRSRG